MQIYPIYLPPRTTQPDDYPKLRKMELFAFVGRSCYTSSILFDVCPTDSTESSSNAVGSLCQFVNSLLLGIIRPQ
uniref:Ovule protein n=1 Tax=Panagrellus redivivus TaxID=6233 RepID=A0A7E4V4B6_PANRE